MTIDELSKLKDQWLERAEQAVRQHNWLAAGDAYKTAAFYEHVIKTVKGLQ